MTEGCDDTPFFVLGGLVGFASVVHLPAIEWSILPIGVAWTLAWIAACRDHRRIAARLARSSLV